MLTNRHPVRVELGDCDPTGIVYHPRYFVWIDTSVHALLRAGGIGFDRLLSEWGIDGLPLVETRARFLAPCRWGDQLVVETAVAEVRRSAFDLRHRIFNGDVVAVEGLETRVWTVRRPGEERIRSEPIPEAIVAILTGAASA